MLEVTLVGGDKFEIAEADVVRIQKAIPGVMKPGSKSRIDAQSTFDVLDDAEELAAKVKLAVKSKFTKLTLPNGNNVWFLGPKSQGPLWIPQGEISDKVKSAISIANKRLFVRNTPQEVASVVKAAEGYVLPIPSGNWTTLEKRNYDDDAVQGDWPDQVLE